MLSADSATFEQHLKSRSAEISSAISQLFARPSESIPEVSELQGRIAHLLAVEKGHIVELEKSREEKFQLEERLEGASLRYLVAEKKLDRVKSATVAKLERQIAAGGGVFGAESAQADNDVKMENTDVDVAAAETARKEAVAASCKQKEQLDALEAANEKLTKEVTTLNVKMTHLTDDDYAKTDLFKHLKSQHEDVIKRINDLEATNVKLREEAEKLQAERTAYRVQLELESQAAVSEKGAQLRQAESDLTRIRTVRDELVSDVAMRKAAQNQDRLSVNQIKELAASKEDRVKALESEVERLGSLLNGSDFPPPTSPDVEAIPLEELRNRYATIERQYSMLKNELQSMGNAYKKASALANQKVGDLSALEDKAARLVAEKSKADQKYFGAMREKEARDQEFRTSRAQNAKSSEIVAQLKEAEAASRALLVNLEKQLAETKDAFSSMTGQHRKSQQEAAEQQIKLQGLEAQIDELKKSLGVKDNSINSISSTHRKAEVEIEALKVRLAESEKSVQSWQKKGLGNQSQEYEALRVRLFPSKAHLLFADHALEPDLLRNLQSEHQRHLHQSLRASFLSGMRQDSSR